MPEPEKPIVISVPAPCTLDLIFTLRAPGCFRQMPAAT